MIRPVIEPQKSVIAGAVERRSVSHGSLPAAISGRTDLRLAELLTARLCHDLSGPIAAINNGVELLSEEGQDAEASPGAGFLRDAVALVGDSARRAGSRLQFYRFAYGFSGGGARAGPAPYELALSHFDASRIVCDYAESVRTLPADWQKLACNLLSIASEALPRGGRLILAEGPLNVEAIGEVAALSPEARAALMLSAPLTELTARTVPAYFAGLLAKALGRRIITTAEPGRVRLAAVAAGP
jgi:histidine phosphotransferase ChpT